MEKQTAKATITGLDLLRAPFQANEISKLPKPTRAQTDAVRANFKTGVRCKLCGGWHHKDVVHLDYVGHAALTKRLLDCDLEWNWEPVATDDHGAPLMDRNGGMWIRLTVCGMTRIGYGDADGKTGGNAVKEVIGDALRNAAMRFGAALDLWHKGDLYAGEESDPAPQQAEAQMSENDQTVRDKVKALVKAIRFHAANGTPGSLNGVQDENSAFLADLFKSRPDTHAFVFDELEKAQAAIADRGRDDFPSDFPGDFPGDLPKAAE